MRIRKRTPASAACSPGLVATQVLSASLPPTPPPPAPPLHQPKETMPHDEEERDEGPVEEKWAVAPVMVAGDQQGDDIQVPVPAISKTNSAMENVVLEPGDAAAAGRCTRNDGKRWRCKNAVVPGYLFCDRHVAWSTRKRKPRPKKTTTKNRDAAGSIPDLDLEPPAEDLAGDDGKAKDGAAPTPQPGRESGGGGVYYHGGFQLAGRKRERSSGPEPAV